MPPTSPCPACSALLPPSDWASHQRSFHTRPPSGTSCGGCFFSSPFLSHSIAHALLEGHGLPKPEGNLLCSELLPASGKESVEKDGPADILTKQFGTLISPEWLPSSEKRTTDAEGSDANAEIEESSDKISDELELGDEAEISEDDLNLTLESQQITASEGGSKSRRERRILLHCAKCSTVLSTGSRNRNLAAVRHARTCQGVRPFVCSSCGHSSVSKDLILQHQKRISHCKTASVETAKDCEAATIKALKTCFPKIPFNRKSTAKKYAIECAKCGATVRFSEPSYEKSVAKCHALFCWNIRSFACSNCDCTAVQKSHILRHIRSVNSKCSEADVFVVDKEGNEAALRNGLRACFPNLQARKDCL